MTSTSFLGKSEDTRLSLAGKRDLASSKINDFRRTATGYETPCTERGSQLCTARLPKVMIVIPLCSLLPPTRSGLSPTFRPVLIIGLGSCSSYCSFSELEHPFSAQAV